MQLQNELRHERLVVELLFRSLLVGSSKLSTPLLPVNMLLCLFIPIIVSVVKLRVLLQGGVDESGLFPACAP